MMHFGFVESEVMRLCLVRLSLFRCVELVFAWEHIGTV